MSESAAEEEEDKRLTTDLGGLGEDGPDLRCMCVSRVHTAWRQRVCSRPRSQGEVQQNMTPQKPRGAEINRNRAHLLPLLTVAMGMPIFAAMARTSSPALLASMMRP